MSKKTCIPMIDLSDTGAAISAARRLAEEAGFSETEQYLFATAVSELATNIIRYAGKGEILLTIVHNGDRQGVEVIAKDNGPGIQDISQVMQESYSTMPDSLGLGLPGVKRILDEFRIDSTPGKGTQCTGKKWHS